MTTLESKTKELEEQMNQRLIDNPILKPIGGTEFPKWQIRDILESENIQLPKEHNNLFMIRSMTNEELLHLQLFEAQQNFKRFLPLKLNEPSEDMVNHLLDIANRAIYFANYIKDIQSTTEKR